MKKFALLISMVAVGATGAHAADLSAPVYTKAPAVIVAESWAGIYVGGQVGFDWTSPRYTLANAGVNENFFPELRGAAGGGHLGAQGQWGNWVLGLEGNYNWTGLKETDGSLVTVNRQASINLDGTASVVGKLGYAFNTWLLYTKGGWADASIATAITAPTASVKQWQSGWTVGGGAEYKIAHNWVLGAEFDYYRFKFDRSAVGSDGTTVAWGATSLPLYSLSFSLSYLFNVGGPVVAKY